MLNLPHVEIDCLSNGFMLIQSSCHLVKDLQIDLPLDKVSRIECDTKGFFQTRKARKVSRFFFRSYPAAESINPQSCIAQRLKNNSPCFVPIAPTQISSNESVQNVVRTETAHLLDDRKFVRVQNTARVLSRG